MVNIYKDIEQEPLCKLKNASSFFAYCIESKDKIITVDSSANQRIKNFSVTVGDNQYDVISFNNADDIFYYFLGNRKNFDLYKSFDHQVVCLKDNNNLFFHSKVKTIETLYRDKSPLLNQPFSSSELELIEYCAKDITRNHTPFNDNDENGFISNVCILVCSMNIKDFFDEILKPSIDYLGEQNKFAIKKLCVNSIDYYAISCESTILREEINKRYYTRVKPLPHKKYKPFHKGSFRTSISFSSWNYSSTELLIKNLLNANSQEDYLSLLFKESIRFILQILSLSKLSKKDATLIVERMYLLILDEHITNNYFQYEHSEPINRLDLSYELLFLQHEKGLRSLFGDSLNNWTDNGTLQFETGDISNEVMMASLLCNKENSSISVECAIIEILNSSCIDSLHKPYFMKAILNLLDND